MDICESNQAVSLQVLEFMQHVHDVKEESITDYLAWQWRELDKRFHFLTMRTFNHDEESSLTGADVDLELWLVGRKTHVCMAVQAKKFIKQHDSYVKRLNYPNGSKQQMNTLLSYALANKKIPFYFIYSIPQVSSSFMCGASGSPDCGVFMADAKVMEEFADGKRGKRVSRDDILAASNPFHCMFCCPLGPGGRYFKGYFPSLPSDESVQPNERLPGYVTHLLETDERDHNAIAREQVVSNEGWNRFNAVGVYDMRDDA
jgi:hypothetical protein